MKGKEITLETIANSIGGLTTQVDGLTTNLDDLTTIVKEGFEMMVTKSEFNEFKGEVYDRFDHVEFNTSGQERRISILEDKVRQISVKIGLNK